MTRVLLGFIAFALLALLTVRLIYGGGNTFPPTQFPRDASETRIELAFEYPEPIGALAVSGGDVFFTVHSAANPQGNKLLRLRDGVALPFPDGATQQNLLTTPLGLAHDGDATLWVLDHGRHGLEPVRLLGFDTQSGRLAHSATLARDVAPRGSFLSALAVDAVAGKVYLADTSLIRRKPALIVYDVASGTARRTLSGEPPLASSFRMGTADAPVSLIGGLASLRPGVDALALDANGAYLYFAAGGSDGVYRIATDDLNAPAPASAIERYSDKPQSGGLVVGPYGSVFVADVVEPGIVRAAGDRRARRFADGPDWRWPAAIAIDDAGTLWLAETALPAHLLRDAGSTPTPYRVYRITGP